MAQISLFDLDEFREKRDQGCCYGLCPTFQKNPKFVDVFCKFCTRYEVT